MRGTPGQIKVTEDVISGDGGNYKDKTVDFRGGIATRIHKDGLSFVDRGDPTGWDFTLSDFTTDATWRDLDLSSIVPKEAKTVLLLLEITDDAANSYIQFRRKGNSYNYNVSLHRTQVANQAYDVEAIVACNEGSIQYSGSDLTFSAINLLVRGWWQ